MPVMLLDQLTSLDEVVDEDDSPLEKIDSDDVFNHKELAQFDRFSMKTLKERDERYTDLLFCYYEYIHKMLKRNLIRQTVFLCISILILVLSPIQFGVVLYFGMNSANIVPILASAAEVIGVMIVFPKIIAEYLFNANETTSMNNIVSTIQQYDISVRSGIRHTVETSKSKTKNE